jgi:(S)-sulfolactate dehydrogenase
MQRDQNRDDMTRPRVILAGPLHPDARAQLESCVEVIDLSDADEKLAEELPAADGLLVRTETRVNATLLDAAPRLRVVARPGSGLDNIDLQACKERDVTVVYAPGANAQGVAEYVMTLVCDALRPRMKVTAPMTPEEWSAARAAGMAPRQMSEQTFGILGMGHVGRRVAQAAGGLGFRVLYHDVIEMDSCDRFGATGASLMGLLEESDVLSLHVDGRSSNRHFMRDTRLSCLKPTVLLINTSRGFIVDNSALRSFLDSNPQSHAILDVHDPEPLSKENPLWGSANVDFYPHLASRTAAAERAMSGVVDDLIAVLSGQQPRAGTVASTPL